MANRHIFTFLLQLALLLVCNFIFLNLFILSPVESGPLMTGIIILTGSVSFVVTSILAGLILWLILPTHHLTKVIGEKRALLVGAFVARLIHVRMRITLCFVYVLILVIIVFAVELFFSYR